MREQLLSVKPPPVVGKLLRIEPPGVRTAAAAVLPFLLGQLLGYPVIGLMAGLGGLYLSITDKEGATPVSLLAAVFCNAAAALVGVSIGDQAGLAIAMMFVWAFLAGMASVYGEVASQVGFISTIVFAVALGQPADFNASLLRAVEFIAGGFWGVLMTLLLWRWNRHHPSPDDAGNDDHQAADGDSAQQAADDNRAMPRRRDGLIANLTIRSIVFRHALRLSVATTIAIALAKSFRLERGYWLMITVLVIVKPIFTDTRKRAVERVGGSIIGGVLAALLVAVIHNALILDVLLLVFSMLAYSHLRNNYSLYMLFLTPFVVLMIDIVEPSNWHIALLRIVDTMLGAVIALTVSFLLRPPSAFRW